MKKFKPRDHEEHCRSTEKFRLYPDNNGGVNARTGKPEARG